jgi:hypothetical protein
VLASGSIGISGLPEREAIDCSSSIVCRDGPVAVRPRVIDSSYPGGRVGADEGACSG